MKYLSVQGHVNDGVGAQIARRISVWAYCNLNPGFRYVHSPLQTLDHNYDEDGDYTHKWESFFNLGLGELHINDTPHEQIDYVDHKHNFFIHPTRVDLYDKLTQLFLEKYYVSEKPELCYDSRFINVAVHIRRGDIVSSDETWRDRGTSEAYFYSIMRKIDTIKGKPCKFYIFSQKRNRQKWANPEQEVQSFDMINNSGMNVEFRWDTCPFSDFHHFLKADCLVMSKSCYSYVPALFSNAKVYYPNFWHSPKTYWRKL